MSSFVFFLFCVGAVLGLFAILKYIATTPNLTKTNAILCIAGLFAIGLALLGVYFLLPRPCVCANVFFILIEIVLVLSFIVGVIQVYGKYVFGVLGIIAMIYGLYWLFTQGVADGSIVGYAIATGVVGFVAFCIFGLICKIKEK